MARIRRIIAVIILAAITIVCSIAAYYLFATPNGTRHLVTWGLSRYGTVRELTPTPSPSPIGQTLSYANVSITDLKFLPTGSSIHIQRLAISVSGLDLSTLQIHIENARLRIPGCETILIFGTISTAHLDMTLYAKTIDAETIRQLFSNNAELKKINGSLTNIDLRVRGTFSEPQLTGTTEIETLTRDGLTLAQCPNTIDLAVTKTPRTIEMTGTIRAKRGTIIGPAGNRIDIEQGVLYFTGDPTLPSIDMTGSALVEKTKIMIRLKGTRADPTLVLSTTPALPQEMLMVMLATGKSWTKTTTALTNAQLSADVVKDFVDYFVFSGSGSKLADRFGIHDLSVTFDKTKKGVGVKKSVSEKIDASYAVERTEGEAGQTPLVTQKIGGEYKITDSLSIGAEKELLPTDTAPQTTDATKLPANDKIFLKFEKEF